MGPKVFQVVRMSLLWTTEKNVKKKKKERKKEKKRKKGTIWKMSGSFRSQEVLEVLK